MTDPTLARIAAIHAELDLLQREIDLVADRLVTATAAEPSTLTSSQPASVQAGPPLPSPGSSKGVAATWLERGCAIVGDAVARLGCADPNEAIRRLGQTIETQARRCHDAGRRRLASIAAPIQRKLAMLADWQARLGDRRFLAWAVGYWAMFAWVALLGRRQRPTPFPDVPIGEWSWRLARWCERGWRALRTIRRAPFPPTGCPPQPTCLAADSTVDCSPLSEASSLPTAVVGLPADRPPEYPNAVSMRASVPVNWQPRQPDPEAIDREARDALRVAGFYLDRLRDCGIEVRNRRLLEIGPGYSLGAALILAGWGARVLVADRFPPRWDHRWHPKFIERLLNLAGSPPGFDPDPIAACISVGSWLPTGVVMHAGPLEHLPSIATGSIDIVVSNAVLEHVFAPTAAFATLARVTVGGGVGLHQVDFRDHRDMARPLEFLLADDQDFATEFALRHGECGNRWRPWDYRALFGEVGFTGISFSVNLQTDPGYLREFMARLARLPANRWHQHPPERLSEVSGYFTVWRSGGPHAPDEAGSEADRQRSLTGPETGA